MVHSPLVLSLAIILSLQLVLAVGIDNPNLPLLKPKKLDINPNITINVSVDSANKWDTNDYGQLDSVSDIQLSWLSGLQGGAPGEYYHLDHPTYTYLTSNLYDFLTGNIFDQSLNTTDEVQFKNITTNNVWAKHINATSGNFTDLYVSNATLYIGDVKLESDNITLNISSDSPGITTVASDFFEGDGSRLKNINLSSVNQTATFQQDVTIQGDLIVNGTTANLGNTNISGDLDMKGNNIFNAVYDFDAQQPWLNFNGTYLTFNDALLNNSFISNTGYNYLNGTLNVTNIYADNLNVLNLTAAQINAINITAKTIEAVNMSVQDLSASTIFARNFTVNGTPDGFCLSDGTGCENVTYNKTEIDDLINNISLTPGPQGEPGVNGTDGINGTFTDTLNSTQFENNSNVWSINLTWLNLFINNLFSSLTTDNITEGSVNLYDNQSWNQSLAEDLFAVTSKEEVINVNSVGGVVSGTTPSIIGFELKEIIVNSTSGTKFRFEAVSSNSGSMIDRNRKLHDTKWDIQKSIPISQAINYSITSANPAASPFTITFKYLSQNI